jgi:ATP-dependent DNA helicase RecG
MRKSKRTKDKIAGLSKLKESEQIEFKTSFDKEVIITLSAFANTNGGKLFLGVHDNGKINGVDLNAESIPRWLNEIKVKTSPPLIPDVSTETIQGKTVVVFSAPECPIKPVSFRGRCYRRVKNSNHLLTINEVVDLHLKTFNASWDYQLDFSHKLADLSLKKIRRFISLLNRNRENPIKDNPLTVLKKFKLFRQGHISFAAYLLFLTEDSLLTTIEAGRFQTETIIKDSVRIKADLLHEVDAVLEFIKKHISKGYVFTGEAQRKEEWQYPLDALREIVLNAVVHRDYTRPSDTVIKIFDDRIEFYNPGRLPANLSVPVLLKGDYISTPRNKQVADIFKEAGLIEKYGTGVKRIIEAFKQRGLKLPKFMEVGEGFKVVVYCTPLKTPLKSAQKTPPMTPPMTPPIISPNKLTELEDKVLNLIKRDSSISVSGMARRLKISIDTVKEYVTKLKKKKRLKRVGPPKGGYWLVDQ